MSNTASTGWAGPLLRLAKARDVRLPDIKPLGERVLDAGFSVGALAVAGWRWLRGCCGEVQAGMAFVAALGLLALIPTPKAPQPTHHLRLSDVLQQPLPPAPYTLAPWQPVAQKMAALALDAPELGGTAPIYRLRAGEGVRQDLLVWPADGKRGITGAIVAESRASGTAESTLYVELARVMALTGASIDRMAMSTQGWSKFGALEAADVMALSEAQLRTCLGFRSLDDAPLRITGWFCGTDARPMDRATLTCLVDRLDLISAGDDSALRTWFALADQQRSACSGRTANVLTRHIVTGSVQLKKALADSAGGKQKIR